MGVTLRQRPTAVILGQGQCKTLFIHAGLPLPLLLSLAQGVDKPEPQAVLHKLNEVMSGNRYPCCAISQHDRNNKAYLACGLRSRLLNSQKPYLGPAQTSVCAVIDPLKSSSWVYCWVIVQQAGRRVCVLATDCDTTGTNVLHPNSGHTCPCVRLISWCSAAAKVCRQ